MKDTVTGSVTLIGAGCGKGLISCKGLSVLRKADVVVYDDLIDTGLLFETKENCELIYVGKRFEKHSEEQERIHEILAWKAGEGKAVVRLKGGDGFVFGRGGEEMLALKEKNIPVCIIPGISSAIAVPENLGIPVTHRGMAQSVTLITGHTAAGQKEDYETLAKLKGTLVFLMGLHHAEEIAKQLIQYGRDPMTPAAILCNGFRAGEKRINGRLRDTAEMVKQARTPAVFLVGEVAGLDLSSTVYEPLKGASVTLTGTRYFTEKLEKLLVEKGACVEKRPGIEICPDFSGLPEDFFGYDWLAFTSANGIRCFFSYLKEKNIDYRKIAHLRFACIGSGTAQTLKEYGFTADLIPKEYTAEALGRELAEKTGPQERLLILRAENGSRLLNAVLDRAGTAYEDCKIYETKPFCKSIENQKEEETDYIVFASALGARAYLEKHKLSDFVKVVCIGEATAAVLGDRRVLLPAEHTAAAIADLIEEDYLEEGKDWKEKEDRDEKISQIEKQ